MQFSITIKEGQLKPEGKLTDSTVTVNVDIPADLKALCEKFGKDFVYAAAVTAIKGKIHTYGKNQMLSGNKTAEEVIAAVEAYDPSVSNRRVLTAEEKAKRAVSQTKSAAELEAIIAEAQARLKASK